MDQPRAVGFQLPPQILDVNLEGVRDAVVALVPDVLVDAGPGQNLAGMAKEEDEQGVFLRGEIELVARPLDALRGQIDRDDFVEREGGAVMLEGEARKSVLVAYQERKQENLGHPLLSETVPLGLLPHLQARLLARTLRGDAAEYLPYLVR